MFNLQNCHWGQISLVLLNCEYSNTNAMKTQMMCDDMIWYGVEDVSIYQASDRSQSWACVTWQAGPGCPGCHWPSPDNNAAAAVPCPLSGDNWWVLLLCHLGQETLHTGTSPWSPCTAHLNRTSIVFLYNYMERSWGCHEVSQHIYFWIFIICLAKYFPFSLKSTTVRCPVS